MRHTLLDMPHYKLSTNWGYRMKKEVANVTGNKYTYIKLPL